MKLEKIHEDARGEIYLLKEFKRFEEVTMFVTKKGYARGGCIHKLHNEHTCILEGNVTYIVGNKTEFLSSGDTLIIPQSTPHYFYSITDSVVLEWGALPEEKKEKHKLFRQIVDKINRKDNDN